MLAAGLTTNAAARYEIARLDKSQLTRDGSDYQVCAMLLALPPSQYTCTNNLQSKEPEWVFVVCVNYLHAATHRGTSSNADHLLTRDSSQTPSGVRKRKGA